MATAPDNVTPLRKTGIQPGDSIEFRRSELCTDASAARVFTEKYGGLLKWNPSWGWLIWTGRKWQRDDEEYTKQAALEIGPHFRSMAAEFHADKEPDKLVHWVLAFARKCESARGVEDLLKVARPVLYESLDRFDTHPALVNFNNCVLNFDRIEGECVKVLEHGSAYNLTKGIAFDYHMGAPCPRWQAFLEGILPDKAVRDFVQRAVGYSLLGTTQEQCLFILWGTGANGKSTFLNTLLNVIGPDYSKQANPRSFMVQHGDAARFDMARMEGVRFLSAIETADGNRLNESTVKAMTGGDRIVAEFKYKDQFEYTPTFKIWMGTNYRPTIKGTDQAIWRRIRLVPFSVTIPQERQDGDLGAKLLREAEGILNWAVEGAISYKREGLRPPAEVVKATAEYRSAEDIVGQFLADFTVRTKTARVQKGLLYTAYEEWADRQGEVLVSAKTFGIHIGNLGLSSSRGTGGKRFWNGLGLSAHE